MITIDDIKKDQIKKLRSCCSENGEYLGTEKKKIYILGQMTGQKDHNFERFFEAERKLTEMGFQILNPARNPLGLTPEQYIQVDLQFVFSSDSVYRLNGWENSKGACLENALAEFLGLDIYDE